MAEPFMLPGKTSEYLPPELDEAQFENLDRLLQIQEARQLNRTLEDMEGRGFFKSGQTLKRVSEDVLGPSIERRGQALLGLAREGAFAGREERLGEVGFKRQQQFAGEQFERQRQFAGEEHLRRLAEISHRATVNKQLMELQSELEDSGGFGIGDFLGQAAGFGIGSMFGGIGAGVGAGIGGRLGGMFEKKSTGRSPTAIA